MKKSKPNDKSSQSQKEKFMAMAKELGNTTELAFNRVLKRVGKAKVPAKKQAKR